jgi:hypothetical protein
VGRVNPNEWDLPVGAGGVATIRFSGEQQDMRCAVKAEVPDGVSACVGVDVDEVRWLGAARPAQVSTPVLLEAVAVCHVDGEPSGLTSDSGVDLGGARETDCWLLGNFESSEFRERSHRGLINSR